MIDGSGRAGHGVAYSTTEPAHLLNVRAEGMSALADDPDHFARRFEAEGGDRRGFAQRSLFGRYLRELLEHAIGKGQTAVDHSTAIDAEFADGTWRVTLDDGRTVRSSMLALAIGNQEPGPLSAFAEIRQVLVNNPWDEGARSALRELAARDGAALLVGTGLTMVDLVLSLDAAGHRGKIVALSRRGQIPRAHANFEPAPVPLEALPSGSLRGLWRWLRQRSTAVGWRAAVDSLRPHSHDLWQRLGHDQQRRFLRHARPWWDVHRHRIAPEVAAVIHRMVAQGRLQIVAGRIIGARPSDGGAAVEFRRRGADRSTEERFDYVFNCTGPLHAMERTRDPLLRGLLDRGAVRPDHLGIGLEVDELSRAGNRLWALGPLTKGRYWEIIAVPDIREQAAAVADDIARELEQ